MDVNGVTQCNAEWSKMVAKYLVFSLQKKEGRTEWFISLYAASLTIKPHSQWLSTCLDKWLSWNPQHSRTRTFIHMALTWTASCGQSSNMFSLHLWHMKPYGIIYPLGRDHFQTGRLPDTIISCGVLDQEQAEIGRKQKGAYVVLRGHVKNFLFLNHLSSWSFFAKESAFYLSVSCHSAAWVAIFSTHSCDEWSWCMRATAFPWVWVWFGPADRYVTCWEQSGLGATAANAIHKQVVPELGLNCISFLSDALFAHAVGFTLNHS